MNPLWTGHAWEENKDWQASDASMVAKIHALIKDTKRSPFRGLGRPEPLKGDLAGFWSRRILGEHRLVYRITGKDDRQQVEIIQCRYHDK